MQQQNYNVLTALEHWPSPLVVGNMLKNSPQMKHVKNKYVLYDYLTWHGWVGKCLFSAAFRDWKVLREFLCVTVHSTHSLTWLGPPFHAAAEIRIQGRKRWCLSVPEHTTSVGPGPRHQKKTRNQKPLWLWVLKKEPALNESLRR